jgi:hypothetical protein
MQNERMPKQISIATMEGKAKIGRPRKRQRDEVEENLNIIAIKKKAGSGQRPSGIEEDKIGNQGLQWTAPLEEEEQEEEKEKEKKNVKKKMMMIMMTIMSYPKRKCSCIMCRYVS